MKEGITQYELRKKQEREKKLFVVVWSREKKVDRQCRE
jgi:hypothetical protein